MAVSYKVVVPLVITKKEDGSDQYLYEGAVLPAGVSSDEIKRLSAGDFIEKVTADEEPAAPAAESN